MTLYERYFLADREYRAYQRWCQQLPSPHHPFDVLGVQAQFVDPDSVLTVDLNWHFDQLAYRQNVREALKA